MVRQARNVLSQNIITIFDRKQDKDEEIERLQQAMNEKMQVMYENEVDNNDSNPKRKRDTYTRKDVSDLQLLQLADSSEYANATAKTRIRTSYNRLSEQITALETGTFNTSHSMLAATAVILAKEIRKLTNTSFRSVATSILQQTIAVLSPDEEQGLLGCELPMANCLYQRTVLNRGRRPWNNIRRNQLTVVNYSPLLLQPWGNVDKFAEKRRPQRIPDGRFCGPVPLTDENMGEDRSVVLENYYHGPGGIVQYLRPVDRPYLPYAPHVLYRLKSILDCAMEQEIWPDILEYLTAHPMVNVEEHVFLIYLMSGGDGAGTESTSSRSSTHLMIHGVTVAYVVLVKLNEAKTAPILCHNPHHHDFKDCCGTDGEEGPGCQTVVWRHPNPNDPASFRVNACGIVDENRREQRKLIMDGVNWDFWPILENGYTWTAPNGFKMWAGIECVTSKLDEKFKNAEGHFGASTKNPCMLCGTNGDQKTLKGTSKWRRTYTAEEIRQLRQRANASREAGDSKSKQYEAGNGYGGTILTQYLHEHKHHEIVQSLHAKMALGGRMMMYLFTLTFLNDTRFNTMQREEWNDLMKGQFVHAQYHVKGQIVQFFSRHLGLRDAAKLARLTSEPRYHERLVSCFVTGDKQKTAVMTILTDFAYIMKLTRATYVPSPVVGVFKKICVNWSNHLELNFPTLPWPRYMHFMIAHGQDCMMALGSMGFWSEEASEHVNKLFKYHLKWNSRPKIDDSLVDILRRLWDYGDPLLRQFR
jgi:hypothetical protein